MKLSSLSYQQFRNLQDFDLSLSEGITVLQGLNAQGKTNFLESIYALALTKSFRTLKHRDLIQRDADFMRVSGKIITDSGDLKHLEHYCEQRPLKRSQNKIDDVVHAAKDYIGTLNVVTFIPDDLQLITGSPQSRRRYLDIILSQIDSQYLSALSSYNKTLKERNALLFLISIGKSQRGELDFWDQRLAELSVIITRARMALIDFFTLHLEEMTQAVSNDSHTMEMRYQPSFDMKTDGDAAAAFLKQLVSGHDQDIQYKTTRKGPHRDDFEVRQNKYPLAVFGSRGEIRTAILALKLCELLYFQHTQAGKPILLLDDVFSELDSERQKALLQLIEGHQTIISTTDQIAPELGDCSVFHVENGILTPS